MLKSTPPRDNRIRGGETSSLGKCQGQAADAATGQYLQASVMLEEVRKAHGTT